MNGLLQLSTKELFSPHLVLYDAFPPVIIVMVLIFIITITYHLHILLGVMQSSSLLLSDLISST